MCFERDLKWSKIGAPEMDSPDCLSTCDGLLRFRLRFLTRLQRSNSPVFECRIILFFPDPPHQRADPRSYTHSGMPQRDEQDIKLKNSIKYLKDKEKGLQAEGKTLTPEDKEKLESQMKQKQERKAIREQKKKKKAKKEKKKRKRAPSTSASSDNDDDEPQAVNLVHHMLE